MEKIAKIFKNGRSQAVRLPKDFRFECDRVKIKKQGKKVILEPVEKTNWPSGFWELFTQDPDFPTPEPLPSMPLDLDRL
ncbi:MAG: type II toxin-antitoxin system VapB family antitoxin [Desulfobacteraceae bacterium]|nr:type II toxin-antitoxin system VapB family antitoxin [Desulfobacteraceae bacterium]